MGSVSSRCSEMKVVRTAAPTPSPRRGVPKEKVIDLVPAASRRAGSNINAAQREQLVLEFRIKARKLARSILRKWHARLDLAEMESVVDLSLCEAVKRYDPNKGASFITFMYYHLRGNLIRAVSAAANASLIPGTDDQEGDDVSYRKSDSFASASEVAEALCGHDYMLPDEVLFRKEMARLGSEACAGLDALEREIIYRLYVKEQQLIDIARSLGYSRCHISRVKRKALEAVCDRLVRSVKGEVEPEIEKLRRRLGEAGAGGERRQIHRRRPRARQPEAAKRRKMFALAAAA